MFDVNKMKEKMTGGGGVPGRGIGKKVVLWGIGIVVAIVIIGNLNPFVIIGAGERGVVLTFGAVKPEVLNEGLHFRIPLVQNIIKMDVKIHKSQTEASASSKDLQDTHSTVAVNYHIEPARANWVYQHVGVTYKDRIIDPTVQEVVKASTARYTAVELIIMREKVRSEIKDLLKKRLVDYNIIVDDFAIVNFSFSKQFSDAIEAKQTADQLAQKAQRDLERIKIEAEQTITRAKAEAESLRLQRAVISPELIELRQIEASIKAIEKWDGKLPAVTSGVPFINLPGVGSTPVIPRK